MADSEPAQDFLSELGVSRSVRSIVERTAREYEETGEWVSFDTLAYEAADKDSAFDFNELFRLPSSIGGSWAAERVNLTALGLVLAGTAPTTVNLLVDLAKISAERKLKQRDDAKIGQQILVAEYHFREERARRAENLIQLLPDVTGGGHLGDDWELSIFRGALSYRNVHGADDLREVLEGMARERLAIHAQAMTVAPAFDLGGMFSGAGAVSTSTDEMAPPPTDSTAVFVVHGRDTEAKDAIWDFLKELGLHPLDWEEDLVVQTGQGTPLVSEILDVAFSKAQAVVVLMTPDDLVQLHPELILDGERDFERGQAGQPRPNVLFEAGMAFGHSPTRTILVEIGDLRPVSDLGGRHTVRIGTAETLRGLALRLQAAGCDVNLESEAMKNVARFSALSARSRKAPEGSRDQEATDQ